MKGRTTIVAAHRFSTLASMDRILVFNDGQIVEDGRCVQVLRRRRQKAQADCVNELTQTAKAAKFNG
jgi:ATP-binding cassette subfamily B protein